MTNLPPELFYQIALHLPFTSDLLTFSLTSSRVRAALSTPALLKERLVQQGWDVSAWLEEDRNVTVPRSPHEDLERWMRIDHIYSRTVQLFDEAAADSHFSAPGSEQSNPESYEDITSLDHFRIPNQASKDAQLLGRKTVVWLRKLSEVLPAFLTHHRTFLDPFFRRVLQFKIVVFRPFRWKKHLANHRSKVSRCSLDLCKGLLFFELQYARITRQTHTSKVTISLVGTHLLLFGSAPHTM
jgi:hypothetical protein